MHSVFSALSYRVMRATCLLWIYHWKILTCWHWNENKSRLLVGGVAEWKAICGKKRPLRSQGVRADGPKPSGTYVSERPDSLRRILIKPFCFVFFVFFSWGRPQTKTFAPPLEKHPICNCFTGGSSAAGLQKPLDFKAYDGRAHHHHHHQEEKQKKSFGISAVHHDCRDDYSHPVLSLRLGRLHYRSRASVCVCVHRHHSGWLRRESHTLADVT